MFVCCMLCGRGAHGVLYQSAPYIHMAISLRQDPGEVSNLDPKHATPCLPKGTTKGGEWASWELLKSELHRQV